MKAAILTKPKTPLTITDLPAKDDGGAAAAAMAGMGGGGGMY